VTGTIGKRKKKKKRFNGLLEDYVMMIIFSKERKYVL
jgi:hypothetical protein